jgi:choline dehydrogenase-like flavoprotein
LTSDSGLVVSGLVRLNLGGYVLAAGAFETARLLLLSASEREPQGIGNAHDQVGRHLQGHFYPTAMGLFDEPIYDPRGPGVTIATCDFNHDNSGIIGGGMLADDFIVLPIIFWKTLLPPDILRWGVEAKDFMRRNYRRTTQVRGPVQEIPSPECRVALHGSVRDGMGIPVASLSGTAHPETLRTAEFMRGRATEWLKAAGASRIWSAPIQPRLSGGQHQAGTCRMGDDPRLSVTDSYGRVWGHGNLVVTDASLHPTNGGFNPVLTVMALAFRNSGQLARAL